MAERERERERENTNSIALTLCFHGKELLNKHIRKFENCKFEPKQKGAVH
jgi:ribose 5-phosphate isomerase RpiB